MKSTIRRTLLVAVFGLMMTAFSSFRFGGDVSVKALAATDNSCDKCIKAVQNDRAVCSFLIKICGVDWFVDPCEFSPGALCECAIGCDSSSATSRPGS
jgi:hypothetical protein